MQKTAALVDIDTNTSINTVVVDRLILTAVVLAHVSMSRRLGYPTVLWHHFQNDINNLKMVLQPVPTRPRDVKHRDSIG